MSKGEFIDVFADVAGAARRKHLPELPVADRIVAELGDQDKGQAIWRRFRARWLFMTPAQCRRELQRCAEEVLEERNAHVAEPLRAVVNGIGGRP